MEVEINCFHGEFEFLSNFHMTDIPYKGIVYPSTEHAFQAQKVMNLNVRREIAALDTPGKAKRMGKKVKLRPDWEQVKDEEMYEEVETRKPKKQFKVVPTKSKTKPLYDVCFVKFFSDPELNEMLQATGDAELIEGNTWGDKYWGVCRGEGQNKLGKILMRVREEMRM
jgi:predicted NAD-dependent protein-ADP-ribosyltransferase YbiA (DUF1768 family)